MSKTDQVDTFLKDNPHIALLVQQIEELMELHNRLVAEGRLPAFKLMGLTPGGTGICGHKPLPRRHNENL